MKDTTYTRFDIWNDGGNSLVISEEFYRTFLVGMYENGNFRENGLARWTRREDGEVTEYTVLWFYAGNYDVESDKRTGVDNGYVAGKTVSMFYLKEQLLCDCCEHEADNDGQDD